MAILLSAMELNLKLPQNNFYHGLNIRTPLPFFQGLNRQGTAHKNEIQPISLALKSQLIVHTTSYKIQGKGRTKKPVLSEGRDEDEKNGDVCPGCGVFMQDEDPNLLGYYQKRKVSLTEPMEDGEDVEGGFYGVVDDGVDEEENSDGKEIGDGVDWDSDEWEAKLMEEEEEDNDQEEIGNGVDWDSDEWEAKLMAVEENDLELDGFAPADVGYGNITEETVKRAEKKRISKSEKKRRAKEAQKEEIDEVTVCARCHSLRNYGQVKNQAAENLIPDFDFDRLIANRLMKSTSNLNNVVVMVVDCVDFDGSFPKQSAKSLFKALEGNKNDPKMSKKLPKLVLVATKVDLLPSLISPTRLDRWVRHRAKAVGAPKLTGVYLVSSRKDVGVKNLLSFIKELSGPRGNVWVIGAQNAGKSTLINALAKKERAKVTKLTEAPIPGTTLGILRIAGILSAKAKLFDTPGLLHPYLVSMRLNREEQKMVEIRKELQPRTYRVKVGQAVHVGGLVRLDLNQASVATIYVTVWASPNVSLHLGKVENADEIWKKHAGIRLQPPIGIDRASEIGKWEEREVKISGTSWAVNSIDISIAGLGWFSLGLKGEATLTLWIYDGMEVTLREPLVLDRAPFLERPGFWLPKAISNTIGNETKLDAQRRISVEEESVEPIV